MRHRCREFAERFTIEGWREAIATHCLNQWGGARVDGRLRA